MGQKEKIFPLNTIGGRIQLLRYKLGFSGDAGKERFYDFIHFNEPTEKEIKPETKRKNISNWEHKGAPVPILKKICKTCDCSSDYLLGIEKEQNHDLHFICKYTGLSEDAVNILHTQKDNYFPLAPTVINFLLENDENISDKLELLNLILQYVSAGQNIKSYDECDVPKIENKNIILRDEYGTSMGFVPVSEMPNIFLLSMNRLLTKLRDNIHIKLIHKKPTIFKILNDMLSDLKYIEDTGKSILENGRTGSTGAFCFDIDELSRKNRRFNENKNRLIYLYNYDTINDIDFEQFQSIYPNYSDSEIELLKNNLNL